MKSPPAWPTVHAEIHTGVIIESPAGAPGYDGPRSVVLGETLVNDERICVALIVEHHLVKCLTEKALIRRVKPELVRALRAAIEAN